MGTITRGTKLITNPGSTAFSGGTPNSGEFNTDLDIPYSLFNGNIENSNIKAAAAIATSKLGADSGGPGQFWKSAGANQVPTWATKMKALLSGNTAGATLSATTLAVDAVSSYGSAGDIGGSLSWTHTTSGSNRFLLLFAHIYDSLSADPTVASATYGGVGMTLLAAFYDSATYARLEVWYLRAPTSGANTLTFTLAGGLTARLNGSAISFTSASQSTGPYYAANSGSGLSIVSSGFGATADSLVATSVSISSGLSSTPGSGQTERYDRAFGDNLATASTQDGASAGASSFTILAGSDPNPTWVLIAVRVIGSGGASIGYCIPTGSQAAQTAAALGSTSILAPATGTLRNLYVEGNASGTAVCTLRVNGVAALIANITSSTTGSNTSDTYAVSAGDDLDIVVSVSSGMTALAWGCEIV